jgi:hypothetical protein
MISGGFLHVDTHFLYGYIIRWTRHLMVFGIGLKYRVGSEIEGFVTFTGFVDVERGIYGSDAFETALHIQGGMSGIRDAYA